MTTTIPRILKFTLVLLTVLATCGVSCGQSLYEVVISISDRQRVLNQREQVATYLNNQNNETTDPDHPVPGDQPVDWVGVGANPSQSAVDGLDIGGKTALLNQAVDKFDRLKFAFLNSSPEEFAAGQAVGALRLHNTRDFDPLPRATPENHHELLRLLAQRVRALQLLQWPSAFRLKEIIQYVNAKEVVVDDDPDDANGDGDRESRVEIRDRHDAVIASATWADDIEQIGPDDTDVVTDGPRTSVGSSSESRVAVWGAYDEIGSASFPELLRTISTRFLANYAEEVRISATAPGGAGIQIDGTVYILRRSHWQDIGIDSASARFEPTNAGYMVEGSGNTGTISLFDSPPAATVNGSWVTKAEDGDPNGAYYLEKVFVEDGYDHKEASIPPPADPDDPGDTDDYNHSYEQNWKIGCYFFSVFKPTFTRGVDAPALISKLEITDGILSDGSVDGELLLHPRPSQLFGIRLGPGLKGAGNGYLTGGSVTGGWWELSGYTDDWLHFNANPLVRFDSSYSLQLAGSHSDYHVVYENDRSARAQSLPNDGLGWFHSEGGVEQCDTKTLYRAWDSPRLKQIAGRDLVVDVTYNANHYGGNTVKVYRRSTGATAPSPGQILDMAGMTLIRTWTFTSPEGATAHPSGIEKLIATGSGGEKFEIQAHQPLPNQGLELETEGGYGFDWWEYREGSCSWTLKLLQGTNEKLKRVIQIQTDYTNGNSAKVIDSVDGQETSRLSSMTLDPFTANIPADWTIESAGKTITGAAEFDYNDPISHYGRLPSAISIDYDGIMPDAVYAWDAEGLLSSATQGPWSMVGSVDGDAYRQIHQFNSSTYTTRWTEFPGAGNKVKTYSAPDGNAGSKSHPSVAWSEIEYGTANSGLPGLPRMVKNSDGTGTTFSWNTSGVGSHVLTHDAGLLSGSSVSRGSRLIQSVNSRSHPTQIESFSLLGGTLKTGGAAYANMTAWGMPRKSTDYRTGLDSTWSFDSNLSRLSSHTGSLGIASSFSAYDALGRPGTVSANGISSANTYNAFSTSSTISGGATGSIAETRDTLGRLTSSNTTWNSVTDNLTITPNASPIAITRSQSLLGTHTGTLRKDDGSLVATAGPTQPFGGNTGTALTVENGLFKSTTSLAGQTTTYQSTWTDAWGRIRKTVTPTGTTDILHSAPSSAIRRTRTNEPSGRKLITESDPYNAAGAITRSGIDIDQNGELGTADRYVESTTNVFQGKIRTTLSLTEDSGLREILRSDLTPQGNLTVTTINGGEETLTRTPDYQNKTITTTSTKGWSKTESFNNLGLTTNSALTGPGIPPATLIPAWRADGSLSGVSFTAGGDTHSATFNPNGTLATLTAPGKGDILGSHGISGGNETLTVDGVTTVTKLDGTQVATSGGDIPHKTETLTTSGSGFKHTTTPTIGAATEIVLNAAIAPTAKNYAAGAGESRQYLSGGLLEKITLARGGNLIFGYSPDGAKDLTSATWPQVTSGTFTIPSIFQSYGHNRAGRVDEIGDASGARAIIYQNGRHKQTVWNSGPLSGFKIVRGIDSSGRDTGFELHKGATLIHSATNVPNGVSGEISSITSGTFSATYGRDATTRNLTSITRGGVIQNWPRTGGRITGASSNVAGAPGFSYTQFDAKGRRQNCTTTGGTWIYQYTSGRLTSATHPTLGSFSYGFDGIGRRTDMGSANVSDVLNRTLAWENSQNKTVRVTAAPAAQVWFNGTPIPNFTGSYTHPVPSPGAAGGWFAWNTLAVLPGQGDLGAHPDAKAEQSGAVWVPPINESFAFDAAGNRESSALWNYGWDAKNQLVRARTKNHNTAVQGYDITNAYDAEGRRFSKKVNRYQNGQIVEQKIITFLHDGNDLVYEREQLPSGLTICERKYVWGPDISGTHGGAGGAGGLLLILETRGNVTTALYPLYDGSGNVSILTDNTGNLQAEYGYGPFGESLYARGPKAASCPFRFQTKYLDQETGHYCYLRRIYDPPTAQFLSRDPLGEKESLNLYQLTGGDPINYVDVDGLAKVALDGKGNITPFGQIILDIAKGDPNAARSLLMAKQVDAETAGIAVTGDGGEDSIRNVTKAIETAIGNAQEDGRDEWKMIAAKAGLSGERYFGGYKDAWMTAKLAEYAPQIAANAGAALELRAAERAMNDKATAYQNSAAYKLREFADAPMNVGAALFSGAFATDVTTGNAVTWNSWNNGGGFGLAEVTPGERAFASSLVMFGSITRGAGFVDDFVRVGARGRSFAGTALKPWGASGFSPKFWNQPIEQGGRRVFQRADIFEATADNLALMRKGRPPIGFDGESVNLHHLTQREPGSIAEVAGGFHSQNTGILHGLTESRRSFRYSPDGKTTEAEKAFRRWSYQYWQNRAAGF